MEEIKTKAQESAEPKQAAEPTLPEMQKAYQELNKRFSDLFQQYQKLSGMYREAMQALQSKEFDYMSFFLSMLFKVMEHPNRYPEKFIQWTSKNIQGALITFEAQMRAPEEEEKKEAEKKEPEKKDEDK